MNDDDFDRQTGRGPDARTLSDHERRNAETILATYAALAGHFDIEDQRRHYHPDFVDHSTIHGSTFDDLMAFVTGFRANHPTGSVNIDRMMIDGDYIVTQVSARLSPGHPIDSAMEVFRLSDGHIAEHWDAIRPNPDLDVGIRP